VAVDLHPTDGAALTFNWTGGTNRPKGHFAGLRPTLGRCGTRKNVENICIYIYIYSSKAKLELWL
jgi:hypothetical protein